MIGSVNLGALERLMMDGGWSQINFACVIN